MLTLKSLLLRNKNFSAVEMVFYNTGGLISEMKILVKVTFFLGLNQSYVRCGWRVPLQNAKNM